MITAPPPSLATASAAPTAGINPREVLSFKLGAAQYGIDILRAQKTQLRRAHRGQFGGLILMDIEALMRSPERGLSDTKHAL